MGARSRSFATLLSLLAVSACDAPAELVVVVHEGSGELLSSFVQINEGPQQSSRGGSTPPWTLGVTGRGGETVRVHVQGRFASGTAVHDAEVQLVSGQRRTHHVHLFEACTATECDGAYTCEGEAAECVCQARGTCPYSVVDGELEGCGDEVFEEACAGSEDAGPGDAGPRDAGPDAATPPCEGNVCFVSAGRRHACGVARDSRVLCWGSNDEGELGDDGPPRAVAREIESLGDVEALALGAAFSCGQTLGGQVTCWGSNSRHQLGSPGPSRWTPEPIEGLTGATQLVAGDEFACALAEGAVSCWGDDTHGQSTAAATGGRTDGPAQIGLSFTPVGVAAGARHACAWSATGDLRCWGDDRRSQALEGEPMQLGDRVLSVAAGDAHTCAIVEGSNGIELLCWGANDEHQSGPAAAATLTSPRLVALTGTPQTIAAGGEATCVVIEGGRWCWGKNDEGSLALTEGDSPAQSPTLGAGEAVTQLSVGDGFGCAVVTGGAAECWGWNLAGAVGDGSTIVHSEPHELSGVSADEISLGDAFGCVLDGPTPICWGAGVHGQLGDGQRRRAASAPLPLADLMNAKHLSVGARHVCLEHSGIGAPVVSCWGDNRAGQAGASPSMPAITAPRQAFGVNLIAPMAAGGAHTCLGATDASEVLCWGDASRSQIGADPPAAPQRNTVSLNDDMSALSLGRNHSCAVVADGSLRQTRCWGANGTLQLGHPDGEDRALPSLTFVGTQTAEVVAAGDGFTCRNRGAEVECVGENDHGELGDGTTSVPTAATTVVQGIDSPLGTLLAAGAHHACAVTSTSGGTPVRSVVCWGDGRYGQSPPGPGAAVVIARLPGVPIALAAGARTSCVVYEDESVWCWGSDEDGRLGTARELVFREPSAVAGTD